MSSKANCPLCNGEAESFARDSTTLETSAALWYLCAKVVAAVDSDTMGDIDDYLMRMVVGIATNGDVSADSTDPTTLPRPIRVHNFLETAEKDIEGFSEQYGILSEYSHPNWAGTMLLFAKHDKKNLVTNFGPNMRLAENTKVIGAGNLSVALAMFETSYNRLYDLMPRFVSLGERGRGNGGHASTESA